MLVRFLQIAIALILSQGWQWARIAEEQQYLTAGSRITIAVCLTVMFVAHQLTLLVKRPAKRQEMRDRAQLVDVFLEHLLASYYKILERRAGQGGAKPIVRANVMLPVIDWLGLRKRLQICYKACPEGVKYGRDELDLFWASRNGVVGWVWSRGHAETYGVSSQKPEMLAAMTPRQKESTKDVKSVSSIPILVGGKPVGVLNLDGQEDLDRTLFDTDDVRDLMRNCAGVLSGQCFPEQGVKPK